MKIDRHTEYKDFAAIAWTVSEEDSRRIQEIAVRDRYGEAGFYAMTVGELTTVMAGDPRPLYDSGGRTVFDHARVDAFGVFIDELAATLRRLTPPPTAHGARLAAGTLKSDFTEGLYLFTRSYFGLRSFREADGIKVSEYLLARKDDYNRQVVDRNTAAMMKGGH